MKLEERDRRELIGLARECIECALRLSAFPSFPERDYAPTLRQKRSAFVTLRTREALRGCCGSIEPSRSLAEEVWHAAWSSAFRDPRFPPLGAPEWPAIHLRLSVLELPQPLDIASEEELLAMLRPGIDGLVLECNGARATFLPSVWDQLPDAREFVRHLKAKAGWSERFWSPAMRAATYMVEDFEE